MNQSVLSYVIDSLVDLCRIPSPTGFATDAIAYVERQLRAMRVERRLTRKGALVAFLPGSEGGPVRTLAAHVDTLGCMVKEIKKNGRLRLTRVGGYSMSTVEGEYCTVHTASGNLVTGTILVCKASTHVHGEQHHKQERNEENMEVRLDARVASLEDVKALGIQVGDFVSLDPRTTVTPDGFIKSRHLDNKACAAVLLGLARMASEGALRPSGPTYLFFSNYEETGHGASAGIPPETDELVALDMAAMGDGQTSDEYSVTVCVKDSSGPYDYDLSRHLQRLAAENAIPYQIDIYPFYGSDASAALRAGGEFRAALVGPGIDASHSYERTHMDSLAATTRLMVAYLTR